MRDIEMREQETRLLNASGIGRGQARRLANEAGSAPGVREKPLASVDGGIAPEVPGTGTVSGTNNQQGVRAMQLENMLVSSRSV